MKIETGIMVMKDGKAWGVAYQDGNSTSYGWVDPESACLYDPKFCKEPGDVTYACSPYIQELKTAQLVAVERSTKVIVMRAI